MTIIRCPAETAIQQALDLAGIPYQTENETEAKLDFYLPQHDVFIEVKLFHTNRIGEQMQRAPNVIAIQGLEAAKLLAKLLISSSSKP